MSQKPSPVMLIILDGWGYREASESNAIALANTPVWDELWQNAPHTVISGCGLEVGLPDGQMGNSEVGHITLGSGRVIYQDLTQINQAIKDQSFNENAVFNSALKFAKQQNKTVHVLGLLSNGGIHSHEDQIHALCRLVKRKDISKLKMHAFLDGRDTPPQSAEQSLKRLEDLFKELQVGEIASLAGRYYAMDRDSRYERTQSVYDMLTRGTALYSAQTAIEGLQLAYERGETDEFVQATAITNPVIQEDDVIIFMNFRSDRARQLSYAFTSSEFQGFKRATHPKLSHFVTLTEYAADLEAKVAFPKQALENVLGDYLSQKGLTQLRIAETEKYAHVTFFFNGGREQPFEQEDRILIPSPSVPTYDQQPEMSAREITDKLLECINHKTHDVIICNFANADMVGHTGDLQASIVAVETLDQCLGKIINTLQAVGGEALITADHGNVEYMFNPKTQQPHTAHTHNQVPFVYIGNRKAICSTRNGSLKDIAPTLLALLNIAPPAEMTGQSLIKFN